MKNFGIYGKSNRSTLRCGIALLLLSAVVAALVSFPHPASAASVSSNTTHVAPTPPSGFKPTMKGDLSQLIGKDPSVHVETLTLPAAACTGIQKVPSAGNCQLLHYSAGASRLPLPQGTYVAQSRQGVPPGWWYWTRQDKICSIYGCWYWSFQLDEDGIADGWNVWQWNVHATPGGSGAKIEWKGYLYNGGGSPHYAMQFGMNGSVPIITKWGPTDYKHGMRRWIDDYGYAKGKLNWW